MSTKTPLYGEEGLDYCPAGDSRLVESCIALHYRQSNLAAGSFEMGWPPQACGVTPMAVSSGRLLITDARQVLYLLH